MPTASDGLASAAGNSHSLKPMKLQVTTHGLSRNPKAVCHDAVSVRQRDEKLVVALADGLGASEEGGLAARRAVDMMTGHYLAHPQTWSPRRALSEFVGQINRVFHQESLLRHGSPELLCTLSVAAVEGDRLCGFNVGDSPVYLWRRGVLAPLSRSHALQQDGLEHVLARAVGLEAEIEPHFFESSIEDGDIVLLCSDGVSSALSPAALGALLERRASARSIVSTARHATEEKGEPPDDASAIVVEIVSRGWRSAAGNRPLEVPPPLQAGDAIDDYRLLQPMQNDRRVWLAEKSDGVRQVLKFPPLEARDDEIRRDAFVRELWQATRIDSADFVRASVPAEGPLRYYAMEYIDAPTLREALRAGPLPVEETVALGQFLLRAAQFLLSSDQVHGDIKPDNILVLRSGRGTRFKLLDLGSAGEIFSNAARAGTPTYLAPERFRDSLLSERTELYAIGVTLYEALTRTCPYGEIERFQTPHFDTPPKRPSQLNSAIPPWLESIILRAVAAETESRYQNFSEMDFDLGHPERVEPFYRKNTSLFERNPLLFFKSLCLILLLLNLFLVILLLRRK